MTDRFSLAGKTAIVTGGCGILGTRFCHGLAGAGAHVGVFDLQGSAELAETLETDHGVQAAGFDCDVSNPDSVAAAVEGVMEKWGRLDILMNNAATKTDDLADFFEPFESFKLDTWREVMGVNLDGVFLMAQACGKAMLAQGQGGSIIQTASIYGVVAPDKGLYEGSEYMGRAINTPAVYSASKAGVVGLSRYLAAYWGDAGIRVNTLTPGGVESGQNDTFRQRYGAKVPLGRMAERDEMVGAAVFLASDAASYITGQNIMVDGGFSVW